MKNLLFSLALAFSISLSAQKSVVFKNELLPNKVYKTQMTTINKMLMDMGAVGGKMDMDQDMRIGLTMTTGAVQGEKGFPLTLVYDTLDVKMKLNGSEMPRPTDNSLLKAKAIGMYKDGKFILDKEASSNLTPELEESLTQTMTEFQDKVQFPSSPLQIGDSFENSFPMDLPVPGGQPMKMNIKNNYKLIALQNGIGTFEVLQELDFSGGDEELYTMSASGEGKGILKFDTKNSYMSSYEVVLPMKINMLMNDGTEIKMDMNSKSVVTNTIK